LVLLGIFPLLTTLLFASSSPSSPPDEQVNWSGLFQQSSFFLGVQHGFRLGTEPGTRAGMRGRFWRGYYDSLANMHGWTDGDQFYVNYIGHPLQGSVSGFIWVHNDPKFRKAEFGNNSFYWKSRLRATAFSWAYSTQFEIGPFSEATIGKIQSRYPQQGFVDHVATPLVGLGWQVAEDFLDRHVIRRFEDRFENFTARMMVRGWLNPARSFANLMRWKEPWYRDTRPGISKYRRGMAPPLDPPPLRPGDINELSRFEFTISPQYLLSPGPRASIHCLGGLGSAQWNLTARQSWVAEVGGCKMLDQKENFSGDIITYMTGPRFTFPNGRWVPYLQLFGGGKRVTINEVAPERLAAFQAANPGRPVGYESHRLWTNFNQSNGAAISAGAGLDYRLSRFLNWRLFSVDVNHAWMPLPDVARYPTSIRFTAGVTLRTGNW
jgi:hypothetical protein